MPAILPASDWPSNSQSSYPPPSSSTITFTVYNGVRKFLVARGDGSQDKPVDIPAWKIIVYSMIPLSLVVTAIIYFASRKYKATLRKEEEEDARDSLDYGMPSKPGKKNPSTCYEDDECGVIEDIPLVSTTKHIKAPTADYKVSSHQDPRMKVPERTYGNSTSKTTSLTILC